MSHELEALRQRRLLEGLLAPKPDASALPTRETGARASRGLQAYRANADASAERALAAAFPTVQMLVGDDDFRALSREFWRGLPPERGDLGEWGDALPDWLATHAQLAAWPYLADAARLDRALHRCERAADAKPDHASLARLGDTDPAELFVEFMPGVALVESGWPVGLIHRAHHEDDRLFDDLREAIQARRGESVVVSRRGWKAVHTLVDAATAAWTRGLLAGQDLGTALADADPGFDFAAWLATALQAGWLKGIRRRGD
jgi:hypothetical protein